MLTNTLKKVAFISYIISLLIITVPPFDIPERFTFKVNLWHIYYNLIPFHFLFTSTDSIFGFVCNIVLFMPMGFLLQIISPNFCEFKKVMVACILSSIFIETLQLIIMAFTMISNRCFDVDDIIANAIGAAIGFVLYILWKSIYLSSAKPNLRS